MTTDVVKKIGNTNSPVAMDYTSFASWAAAAPASLVTADQRWVGEVYNQGEMNGGSATALSATCSATQCYVLRAATGASFRDHTSAATNPLRYNETVGAAITSNPGYSAMFSVSGTNGYIEVAGLQFRTTGGTSNSGMFADIAGGVYAHDCIFSRNQFSGTYPAAISFGTNGSNNSILENLLIINEGSGGGLLLGFGGNAPTLRNITMAWINNPGAAYGFNSGYGTGLVYNCAFFGFSAGTLPINFSSVSAGGNNITDASSFGNHPPSSPGTTGAAFTTANFTALSGVTTGTGTGYDFRLPSGSALLDVGDNANRSTADILGTTRPQNTTVDIGAYERVAAGGGGALTGTAAATSTATGTLTGRGALTGTAAAASTATATLRGLAPLTGTAAAAATATATLTGRGAVSGTAAAVSTATGTLAGLGALTGTGAAASTATGTLTGAGALAGTASGASTATGTLTSAGSSALTGTAAAAATATGTLTGRGALTGSAVAAAAATGTLIGFGPITGTAAIVGTATGTLTAAVAGSAIFGTATATATATGALTGLGALVGTATARARATLKLPYVAKPASSLVPGVLVRPPLNDPPMRADQFSQAWNQFFQQVADQVSASTQVTNSAVGLATAPSYANDAAAAAGGVAVGGFYRTGSAVHVRLV